MKFEHPFVLILIPVILAIIAVFGIYFSKKKAKITQAFALNAIELNLVMDNFRFIRPIRHILWTFGLIFLLLAIARPQWGYILENNKQEGLSVLFALDTSKSMLADDVRPNRIELAKLSIFELLFSLSGNRVGLIAFSGVSFLQCPITSDFGAFKLSLKALDTNIIPVGGTNISSAIQLAEKTFDNNNSYKRLILITDGENLDGDALVAAENAAKAGIVIYTVGIGTINGTEISIKNKDGQSVYLKDNDGNKVVSKLDESMLKKIASATNGFYVPIGNAGEGLREIYEMTLKHLPKEKFESVEKKPIERFWIFATLALIFLFIESILHCKFRKNKKMKKQKSLKTLFKFKKSSTAIFLLILSNSAFCDILIDNGQKLYDNGDLTSAESYYLKKLETVKDDWRLHFNLGNTFYKQDKFDESITKFEDALKLCKNANKQANIFYNIGNSRYKSSEMLPETKIDEIKSKIAAMEPCLNDYKSALDLDKAAKDIDHNLRFVEKRLDELKKKLQDEQKKQQDDNKDKKENNSEKNQDSDKNQDKNNSENKQDNKNSDNNDKNQEKQNSDEKEQQNNSENKQEKENSNNSQDSQQNSNQDEKQSDQNKGNDENSEKKPASAQEKPSEAENKKAEMESLLKSASGDERILPMMQAGDNNIPQKSQLKDW